jgi:hypothetical protein
MGNFNLGSVLWKPCMPMYSICYCVVQPHSHSEVLLSWMGGPFGLIGMMQAYSAVKYSRLGTWAFLCLFKFLFDPSDQRLWTISWNMFHVLLCMQEGTSWFRHYHLCPSVRTMVMCQCWIFWAAENVTWADSAAFFLSFFLHIDVFRCWKAWKSEVV